MGVLTPWVEPPAEGQGGYGEWGDTSNFEFPPGYTFEGDTLIRPDGEEIPTLRIGADERTSTTPCVEP